MIKTASYKYFSVGTLLRETLIVTQLVKKCSASFRIQSFIASNGPYPEILYEIEKKTHILLHIQVVIFNLFFFLPNYF
jgi:hypothetical protein